MFCSLSTNTSSKTKQQQHNKPHQLQNTTGTSSGQGQAHMTCTPMFGNATSLAASLVGWLVVSHDQSIHAIWCHTPTTHVNERPSKVHARDMCANARTRNWLSSNPARPSTRLAGKLFMIRVGCFLCVVFALRLPLACVRFMFDGL